MFNSAQLFLDDHKAAIAYAHSRRGDFNALISDVGVLRGGSTLDLGYVKLEILDMTEWGAVRLTCGLKKTELLAKNLMCARAYILARYW